MVRLMKAWSETCGLASRCQRALRRVAICALIGHAGSALGGTVTGYLWEDCRGPGTKFWSSGEAIAAGMKSYLEGTDRCFNVSAIEVVLIAEGLITETVVWASLPTPYLRDVEWSEGYGWHVVVGPPPPPPPREDLLAGLCVRPIALFDFPAFTPERLRKAAEAVLPEHHDVQVRNDGTASSVTRGFFAVDMAQAVRAFVRWGLQLGDGIVPGAVLNSADTAGPCELSPQATWRYYHVRTKVITSSANRYHLGNYNCQHWADEQLK